MRHKWGLFSLLFFGFIFLLAFSSCDGNIGHKDTPNGGNKNEGNEGNDESIVIDLFESLDGLQDYKAINIDLDYPYLYIACDKEGLLRVDISRSDFPVENVPVLDPDRSIESVWDVDAEGNDIIVAAQWAGIWWSSDSGNTWQESDNEVYGGAPAGIVSRSPHNPGYILSQFWNLGLTVSEDNGKTWIAYQYGINIETDCKIRWNPLVEGEAWIRGNPTSGIGNVETFRVSDYGNTFDFSAFISDIYPELNNYGVVELSYDYTNGDIIYAIFGPHYLSSGVNIYTRSFDGGNNWEEITIGGFTDVDWMGQSIADPGTFYFIRGGDSLYVSNDSLEAVNFLTDISSETGRYQTIWEVKQDLINNRLIVCLNMRVYFIQLDYLSIE